MLPGAADPVSGEGPAGNLAQCAELAQSQASLQSASSVGSARGDEGAGSTDVYGDYRPLCDNLQDPDNVSLQGGGCWVQLGGSLEGGAARAQLLPPMQRQRRRPSRGLARAAASWRAGG